MYPANFLIFCLIARNGKYFGNGERSNVLIPNSLALSGKLRLDESDAGACRQASRMQSSSCNPVPEADPPLAGWTISPDFINPEQRFNIGSLGPVHFQSLKICSIFISIKKNTPPTPLKRGFFQKSPLYKRGFRGVYFIYFPIH